MVNKLGEVKWLDESGQPMAQLCLSRNQQIPVKYSGCKLRLHKCQGRPRGRKITVLGCVQKHRGKMQSCRRSEMVGWREKSCCALSGGRRRVRWRRGEGPSLRGLEPRTDGAVLAIVQPSPSSSTATPKLTSRQVSQHNGRSVSSLKNESAR